MTSRDFCYWLQGFFEITNDQNKPREGLTPAQVEMVEKHLALVFKHEIDPSYGDEKHQKELDDIHNGPFKRPSSPYSPPVFRC